MLKLSQETLILVVLVVYYVRQNNEGFSERPTVYFFYVDWCPHCTRAKPEVAKLKNNLSKKNNKVNNTNVKVNLVDAEQNKDLARKHNVNAYPTCVLEKANGETVPFNSNVSVDNLQEFLNNNVN